MITASDYWEVPARGDARELLVCHRGREQASAAPQAVVPDGCVDIIWTGGRLIFAGPDALPVVAPASSGGPVAGVRLRMWVAAALLRVTLRELVNARVPFPEIDARGGRELQGGVEGLDSRSASRVIGEYVLGLEHRAAEVDRVVADAGGAILASGGVERVDQLARSVGYSERQLHRRFVASVGYGPKSYARIVRFQHAKRLLERGCAPSQAAWRCGYVDPSHLSRDFASLGGRMPSAVRSEMSKAAELRSQR